MKEEEIVQQISTEDLVLERAHYDVSTCIFARMGEGKTVPFVTTKEVVFKITIFNTGMCAFHKDAFTWGILGFMAIFMHQPPLKTMITTVSGFFL